MNGSTIEDKSASWQQALNIDLNCIQFVHCHQVRTYNYFTLLSTTLNNIIYITVVDIDI